jgi:hypothetical protein
VWCVPLASGRWLPRWIPDLVPVLQRLQGHGERCTLAHIDGKKRCYACNEIKLLEKKSGTDRTTGDGHARTARCATPEPEQ